MNILGQSILHLRTAAMFGNATTERRVFKICKDAAHRCFEKKRNKAKEMKIKEQKVE